MKGIVFTEFLGMVEASNGYAMVDEVINEVDPISGGAYTAVGTYDHNELVALVVSYANKSQQDITEVLRLFGHHLFQVFLNNYPNFLSRNLIRFNFLAQ